MTKRLEVRIDTGSYPILVGTGVLRELGTVLPDDVVSAEVIGLVTDASVGALHAPAATHALAARGARVERFTIEPGEASKDVSTLAALWGWLADIGAHRSDAVVALGGGVVGDVAGLAAATYHRGISFVQVPTTLLAQVDAGIGGKTAIDLPQGKNLVGAFHQPRAVVCDVETLRTLPDHAFATGMAEVVKHGLIAPGGLLDDIAGEHDAIVARDLPALESLVAAAAAVKVEIVSDDERERGRRAHLNYGHTLGHALEMLDGYTRITHGEAIAIGMMFVAELAGALGYADLRALHRDAIAAWGLPTGGAGHAYEDVATAWQADKKFERGVRFVLLEDLGKPVVVGDLTQDVLRAAYEAVR